MWAYVAGEKCASRVAYFASVVSVRYTFLCSLRLQVLESSRLLLLLRQEGLQQQARDEERTPRVPALLTLHHERLWAGWQARRPRLVILVQVLLGLGLLQRLGLAAFPARHRDRPPPARAPGPAPAAPSQPRRRQQAAGQGGRARGRAASGQARARGRQRSRSARRGEAGRWARWGRRGGRGGGVFRWRRSLGNGSGGGESGEVSPPGDTQFLHWFGFTRGGESGEPRLGFSIRRNPGSPTGSASPGVEAHVPARAASRRPVRGYPVGTQWVPPSESDGYPVGTTQWVLLRAPLCHTLWGRPHVGCRVGRLRRLVQCGMYPSLPSTTLGTPPRTRKIDTSPPVVTGHAQRRASASWASQGWTPAVLLAEKNRLTFKWTETVRCCHISTFV